MTTTMMDVATGAGGIVDKSFQIVIFIAIFSFVLVAQVSKEQTYESKK